MDALAETFEDIKTTLQAAGKYHVVELLTDAACTRERLLACLVDHTKKGRTIDLVVLGHGSSEYLLLNSGRSLTGGPTGNVRSLLSDARSLGCTNLNLRMVYMCNCYGSTLNDDWIAIGAKASVGSHQNDYMPEPMTTFFIHNWLGGQSVSNAANNAYNATIPFYTVVYPPSPRVRYKTITYEYPCGVEVDPRNPLNTRVKMCSGTKDIPDGVDLVTNSKVTETRLVVSGDGSCRF